MKLNLDASDVDALRALLRVAPDAIAKTAPDLILSGRATDLRRAQDGIAALKLRIERDDSAAAIVETNALACYRVARQQGWDVTFSHATPSVRFTRGPIVADATNLLLHHGPIEESVAQCLATAEAAYKGRLDS